MRAIKIPAILTRLALHESKDIDVLTINKQIRVEKVYDSKITKNTKMCPRTIVNLPKFKLLKEKQYRMAIKLVVVQ